MSVRNFIGSGQSSEHPLLVELRGVVAYLTLVNTVYRVTRMYANGIYTRDERHAMILISWIETFSFIRGVIIQMTPMKWYNIFNKMQK